MAKNEETTMLTAIVETTENNLSAYIQEVDGLFGVGDTLNEVKESLETSIKLFIEESLKDGYELPESLKGEYAITYKFDLQSFLSAYGKVLSKSGLQTITGINQKQLWHYASGTSKPKKSTVEKVEVAVKAFAKDLMEMEFA